MQWWMIKSANIIFHYVIDLGAAPATGVATVPSASQKSISGLQEARKSPIPVPVIQSLLMPGAQPSGISAGSIALEVPASNKSATLEVGAVSSAGI